jgi:HlyD family secretion protein
MISRKPLVTRKATKKRAWFLRGLLASILLVLAGGGAAWYFLLGPGSASASGPGVGDILNRTTTVARDSVSITASGSGTLVASQTADLSFSTSGTVGELNVKIGDRVKTGDVLARLGETKTLEASLASAKLNLLEAQKALEGLQQNAGLALATAYQNWVTAQQAYNDELSASQRTAYARCGQDVTTKYTAALERAKQKLDDLGTAARGSDAWINAQNDYDTAYANYTYCAAYTDAEKISAQSALEVAKLTLQQAEESYTTLKESSGIDPDARAEAEAAVKAAETAAADAQEMLDGITLIAPIDGVVTSLSASQGKRVDTATFITLSDVSRPTIQVSVDENDIDKFQVGKAALVTFDALPDQSFTGKVVQVNPQLTSSGQYNVAQGLIELDEGAAKMVQSLPLGLNVSVTIISQEVKDVLVVPAAALKESQAGEYTVMVQGSDGVFVPQVVEVGLKNEDAVEITAGLNEGDVVSTGITVSETGSSTDEEQFNPMLGGMGAPPDGGMMGPP